LLAAWLVLTIAAGVAVFLGHVPSHSGGRSHHASTRAESRPATPTTVLASPAPGVPRVTSDGSAGWHVGVFYTAVQRFYYGPAERVAGCADPSCRHGRQLLGMFPRDFVAAVRAQGTGRICYGPFTNAYLSFKQAVGFWLDRTPRLYGFGTLRAYQSVESDSPLLPFRTKLRVLQCGTASKVRSVATCARLVTASWQVSATTVNHGGRAVRLYIGEQPQGDFNPTAYRDAVLRIG